MQAQDPALLRRLLRAKDRMDAASHEEWPVRRLARVSGVSEAHFARSFKEAFGVPPHRYLLTRRIERAKAFLRDTDLPITEIALASGFRSLRRFNAAFQDAYRLAPRELRKRPRADTGESLVLRLGYRPPYDFAALLDFLRGRALPGLEMVDEGSYSRALGDATAPGWLRVSAWGDGEHALRLELHGAKPAQLLALVAKLRRLFDLMRSYMGGGGERAGQRGAGSGDSRRPGGPLRSRRRASRVPLRRSRSTRAARS